MLYCFSRSHRLGTQDFRTVFRRPASSTAAMPLSAGLGKHTPIKHKVVSPHCVVYVTHNTLSYPRLGISVPKHIGTAPHRNRIKRLVRETFRLTHHALTAHVDMVVVAQRDCAARTQHDISYELHAAWKQCGIM